MNYALVYDIIYEFAPAANLKSKHAYLGES